MTDRTTRFRQLLDEIDSTPWGPHEQSLTAEAVALAQELGDEQLEYQARMRQTASANMGGLTDVMLTSFAWCLAHHDADPLRYFLVIAGPETSDSEWSLGEFIRRNNEELVATWGNLVNRVLSITHKNFGQVPTPDILEPPTFAFEHQRAFVVCVIPATES